MRGENRGARPERRMSPESAGLPPRPFLYTLDQIASLVDVQPATLKTSYIYFDGRSTGAMKHHLMVARNIAPPDSKPEWRVAEREFIRWLRHKGFKLYDPTTILY